jgi:thimet oligopeptidase
MLMALMLAAAMTTGTGGGASASANDSAPFLTQMKTAAEFSAQEDAHLARAQQLLDELTAVKGRRTIDNTLTTYDALLTELDAAGSQSGLMEQVHPDSTMRQAAEKFTQKISAFASELSLNRNVYDALKSIDLAGADDVTKYYVDKTLRDFRLAGVDKDDATRAKVKALRDELVLIGQDFARNIRDDVRTVYASSAAELDGLPKDFIERHKPEADGRIKLTINYPDAVPVFTYAKNEALRKRLYMEYNNRAYPKNVEVLNHLLAKRYELAQLLGFDNYAAYVTADKMVASEKNASNFIDKIADASDARAQKEYKQVLARKQQDDPNAKVVNAWESGHYSELVRKAEYNFDAQSVRPYFQYERVKQGVLDVMSRLFAVTFKRNMTAPVWDKSVECWEMFEGDSLLGRFYFDMHPRENKYNHAAQFNIRSGIRGKQIPEGALICNFPGGIEGDPGLMEHSDVETFFHEFGHLLHSLFAGRQEWIGVSGIQTEWDFVEAPSQLLEEWAWDAPTLQTFAKQYETGEPIPDTLVVQMKKADEFGKGLYVRQQMAYAKLSLSCYDRAPKDANLDTLNKTLREKYIPYPFVEGTHMYTSFGHLDGYSAIYYTYMWSLVIAKDFFTQFDHAHMLAPGVAKKYRDTVLAPGGSLPAAQLVRNFLGRDFSFDGWQKWLER